MNWLAHVFLSEENIHFQIGNYLADPLKGRSWEGAPYKLDEGIRTHLKIDSFTDKHPIVINSKNRLNQTGLLRSIVIDITYDYFLTKNWEKFCNIDYKNFTSSFYTNASQELQSMPLNAYTALNRLIEYKILNKYQEVQNLQTAFQRVDRRLSQKVLSRDSASNYYEAVKDNINSLEDDFLEFFPILCKEVKKNIDDTNINHWKID